MSGREPTLSEGKARVLEFCPNKRVLQTLVSFAGSLFDWSTPSLPEDLFIMAAGVAVLETVGHERFAFIRTNTMSRFLRTLVEGALVTVSA